MKVISKDAIEKEILVEIRGKINEMNMLHKEMEETMARLQSENSTLIEEILSLMKQKKASEVSNVVYQVIDILSSEWPQNYLMFEVLLKQHEIQNFVAQDCESDSSNSNQKDLKQLINSITELENELKYLLKNKSDLEQELSQMKENSDKEKIFLRQELGID